MIRFENTEVYNFEGAIRGMRNPMGSWNISDSYWGLLRDESPINTSDKAFFFVGEKDLRLMQGLIKAGSDHRKFMRQIMVCVDITAPLYWWKEFDTYKVGTVANSCSTMHTIHKKEFEITDFSTEHLNYFALNFLSKLITLLNDYRASFDETRDKNDWWQMIQLLPSSYNQKRTVTMNYETIYNMRKARNGHKLDEWSIGFMEWSDGLPYANELFNV